MRISRISVLALILTVAFSSAGCKGDNYTAEKLMWEANKKLAEIRGDNQKRTLSEAQARELLPYYKKVVEECPATNLAAKSQFIVADLFVSMGDVDKARDELDKVINNFPQTPNLRAEAQFYKGYLYETREKDWARAKDEYEKVLNNHEGTIKSLEVPVYIAKHYEKLGDKAAASDAYDKAITYYERSMDKGISRSYVGNCMEILSTCYARQHRYNDALNLLKQIAVDYAETPHAETASMKITNICSKVLKSPEKEIGLYKEIAPYIEAKNPLLAAKNKLRMAQLYMDVKQGEEARNILTEMQEKNKQRNEFAGKLELMIARSYQIENNWEDAKQIYNDMPVKYPKTLAAFQAPILVAQHYIQEGKAEVATEILNDAIEDFREIMKENPDGELAAAAQDYISMSFLFMKKWEDSVDSLKELIANFPDSPRAAASLFAIGSIYQNFIKDSDKALAAYKDFVARYPDHQWTKLANKQIAAITNGTVSSEKAPIPSVEQMVQ